VAYLKFSNGLKKKGGIVTAVITFLLTAGLAGIDWLTDNLIPWERFLRRSR